jgi:glycosyltransferase involved in cell wall biosynthesis
LTEQRGRAIQAMKVLHVIPSVGPLRGGPSVMLQTLARGLSQAATEVHIATTDDNGSERLDVPLGRPVVEEGVSYWYFPRQTRLYTFSWPLSRWLAQHMRDYDVVHIHALFSYAALPAAFWSSHYGIPYIILPHGTLAHWGLRHRHPWLKPLSLRLIERRILSGAAVVHYTSEQERLEAAALGLAERSVVIPNAIDLTLMPSGSWTGRFRARYPQLADRRIILFLSRIDAKKGLDLLLPAFAHVRRQHPSAVLVLAVSRPWWRSSSTKLHAWALTPICCGRVFWLGMTNALRSPTPTSSSCPHTRRTSGWRSSKPWPAGCRWSFQTR